MREEVQLLQLPTPPYPQPLKILTVQVPALNPLLRTRRPDRAQTYPDEDGQLRFNTDAQPVELHLLGRTWVVEALLEQATAMEVDATLGGLDLKRAACAALDALDAPTN